MDEVGRHTYTVQEAARLLGISRGLAYELVKQGRLPVVRLGKRLVVPRAALQRLLEEVPPPGQL
jgi:excisionase family DNA binding protein